MRRLIAGLLAMGVVVCALQEPAAARPGASSTAASDPIDINVKVTHHVVKLRDGRELPYTTRAGFLTLVNDATREETARVYFVAYTADRAPGAPVRPITFQFPGGPGSAETLSETGPLRLDADGSPPRVVQNPDTMLAHTDLVQIDPVGTGYSRMTKPEFAPLFYGVKADRDALVEVVRLYLQRYDPAESPIFMSGGSYGSVRSILVADAAIERGIPVRGIMVSAEVASLSLYGSEAYYALLVPGFTIVAQAHGKLPDELQADRDKAVAEARAWAIDTYLPALAKGNTLSDEQRLRVAADLARYSGLKPAVIVANNLRIDPEFFADELLRDQGKSVAHYDTRMTGPAQSGSYDPSKDPSLLAHGDAYPSLRERYILNRTLGLVSSDYYAGPFGGGWPIRDGTQDWMSAKWNLPLSNTLIGYGFETIFPTLLRLTSRGVWAMFGEGYYDWACPPFGADYVASQVAPSAKDHVEVHHYESGHGVPAAEFGKDAGAFIAKVLNAPAPVVQRTRF